MADTSRRGLAVGILLFASFMDLLDATIVQVALPAIGQGLDARDAELEWIVSGYMLAFAVALITGGRLGDIFGRRRLFLVGIVGFTLASAAGAAAWSGPPLVTFRVIQGLFAALMVPQLLATVQALYTPRERTPVYGIIGAVSGIAAVVGPILGGWLVDADLLGLGWRSILLINVPVGVVIYAIAVRSVPETRSDRPLRTDLTGVALLTAALLCLMIPLIEGRTLEWPAWLWALDATGVALLVLFVAHARRRAARDGSALLPLPLFRNRGFSAGLVTQAMFQGAMNAFTLPFILYLQLALGFDALAAGLNLLAFSIGAMIGTGIAVPMTTKLGKIMIVIGCVLMAAGIAWTFAVLSADGAGFGGWTAAPAMLTAGVGLSLIIIPLIDVALATVPVSDAGAASGTYSTFQQLGAAAGIAVSTTVFFGVVNGEWTQPRVLDALGASVVVALIGLGVAAAAALLLPGIRAVRAHLEAEREQITEASPGR
ncbi:MFS transporter [Microbacterium sp. XT11]|uniref:MFS transporter n=1 Tax=Microbacterium sp. XT11 TaxID=367477 RepID=UPI000743090E|nr:MFS transporter [Microbacterium sp. XT11]ALX66106.1 hypothetical protein AB663_001010 [Microbacterium sp. XT11]